MKNVYGRIHSVESFGALDGPGIRYVLFLQGCPLRCVYCHNPDSWVREDGRRIGSAEVVSDILRYESFIRGGGVTLSGGEPLLQPAFAAAILDGCREHGLHTALDTSGAAPLSSCKIAVDAADMLILDVKAANEPLFWQITGSSIAHTMDLLHYCEASGKRLWVRHVVVPGLTLNEESLTLLGRLLAPFTCIERIELLPFHKLGEFKWRDIRRSYTLSDTRPPTDEEMAQARELLSRYCPTVI